MPPIRVLKLAGSPYEMGYQHGKTYHDAIHQFTVERLSLSGTIDWTGRTLTPQQVMRLAEAMLPAHQAYAPDLMQEIQGMSDATGISPAALIVMNGFTDFIDAVYKVGDGTASKPPTPPNRAVDDCTAFLVPASRTADGSAVFGQTWDMHASAAPHVLLYHGQPDNQPAFLTFTTDGCIGMIGMNDAGIVVGINNIMGGDGRIGVVWNFVVRKILQQHTLDNALRCITEAPLAGAHNYMLMDASGAGYNVEAMPSRHSITPLASDTLVHTNHCLASKNTMVERERPHASLASSLQRYGAARKRLKNDGITLDDLRTLMADESAICLRSAPPLHIETCGAVIMRPQTGEMWVASGLPGENDYSPFTLP